MGRYSGQLKKNSSNPYFQKSALQQQRSFPCLGVRPSQLERSSFVVESIKQTPSRWIEGTKARLWWTDLRISIWYLYSNAKHTDPEVQGGTMAWLTGWRCPSRHRDAWPLLAPACRATLAPCLHQALTNTSSLTHWTHFDLFACFQVFSSSPIFHFNQCILDISGV